MDREQLLQEAIRTVTKDRNLRHGEPEQSFERIAAYWSIHLGVPVTGTDVTLMLALLKVARLGTNPQHQDSWIDGAGYFACGGELAGRLAE